MDSLESRTGTVGLARHHAVSGATMAYLDYGESDCNSIFEIDPSGTTREVFEAHRRRHGPGCATATPSATRRRRTCTRIPRSARTLRHQPRRQAAVEAVRQGRGSTWGGTNHGHHLLDNSLMLFANKGGSNASAVFEFTLDGKKLWSYDSGAAPRIWATYSACPAATRWSTSPTRP